MLQEHTAIMQFKSFVSAFTTPNGNEIPGCDYIALLVYAEQKSRIADGRRGEPASG
ncbi:hypothetical protein SAMN06265348_101120 [Pedobacter westerhofensis]|uniref:Uncharacterized protein n=1 Tax=Pedobacter westerhofensis TaxID=425512 RepID=A0A521AEY3_9SPHI|nr:hypothetical protein SAMN06265348_101120 [Pedobacter westerhofensis]